jgi:HEAT repeat protein
MVLFLLLNCIISVLNSPLTSVVDDADYLIAGLESKDAEERRVAASAFEFLCSSRGAIVPGPEKAIPALTKALGDADPEVRRDVAHVLGWYGKHSKPAVKALATLLSDKVVAVRRAGAGALLTLGPLSQEVLPVLIKAKDDTDKYVRIYAGTAVVGLGKDNEKDLQFLFDFAADKDKEVRDAAAGVFSDIGVRAVPILKPGLKDKNPVVRAWTILAMIQTWKKVTEKPKFPTDAIPLLIAAIGDEDGDVAHNAICAVSELGAVAKDAVPALIKRFEDPDWGTRWSAMYHVKEFGPDAEAAIPALKKASLNDIVEHGRITAQRSLAAIEAAIAEKAAGRKK